jgi:hypothetical protein
MNKDEKPIKPIFKTIKSGRFGFGFKTEIDEPN